MVISRKAHSSAPVHLPDRLPLREAVVRLLEGLWPRRLRNQLLHLANTGELVSNSRSLGKGLLDPLLPVSTCS
eukprot:1875076-Pyramimonas_sp.AAC.1